MELRQVRAFLEVAGERHFGRAAARLNLTQPALTQRIQALERELGVQLFQRNAREVRLTSAGELLLPYARSLSQIEGTALRSLKDHAAGSAGKLRIAYLTSGDIAIPGEVMAEFRRRHPAIELEASSATTDINVERLSRGDLDAAFIALGGGVPPGVETRCISRSPLVLVLSSRHRLARFEVVPASELAGEPFVMIPRHVNPVLVDAVVRWLERRTGGKLNIVAHEPQEQAIDAVLRSDSLVTIANGGRAGRAAVPGMAFRHLSPAPLVDYGLAYMRSDPSPAVANLLAIADEVSRSAQRIDGEPVLGERD